ncbi:hypothetical protein [Cerasicoccus frondis]|uniref:hypothetical protein n=1 Tax=Cerasicoccus frondis TaxID=490090 RepID=UPI0028529DEB|nr:hypothetical protein [Cerasicoccus frondis]
MDTPDIPGFPTPQRGQEAATASRKDAKAQSSDDVMKRANYQRLLNLDTYKLTLSSGMFWEFYPELTGDWDEDQQIIAEYLNTPPPQPKLSEGVVLAELIRERYARNFVIPRFTPTKWWECDLFEVTSAGYFVEYEVKLSLADFKKDAEKQQDYASHRSETPDVRKKHDMLALGDVRGPNRFYFVTPKGMLDKSMIPDWAGWIELEAYQSEQFQGVHQPMKPVLRIRENAMRKAPILHKQKFDEKQRQKATDACYWRWMHHIVKSGNV